MLDSDLPPPVPFWLKLDNLFSLLCVTTFITDSHVLTLPTLPDRPGALPPRRTVTSPQALLRTDHASFPASGSSISKAPIKEPVTSRWSLAWSCR